MKYIIFTDGSQLDKQHHGRLGCGGVILDVSGRKLNEFSEELTPEYMLDNYGATNCSNPTMEMMGVLLALSKFKIPRGSEVTIKADYLGVREWNTGNWKIKMKYIQKLADEIKEKIEDLDLKVNFVWVPGHQNKGLPGSDAYWNNYVDSLAKGNKK